jgi:hypothetical protein
VAAAAALTALAPTDELPWAPYLVRWATAGLGHAIRGAGPYTHRYGGALGTSPRVLPLDGMVGPDGRTRMALCMALHRRDRSRRVGLAGVLRQLRRRRVATAIPESPERVDDLRIVVAATLARFDHSVAPERVVRSLLRHLLRQREDLKVHTPASARAQKTWWDPAALVLLLPVFALWQVTGVARGLTSDRSAGPRQFAEWS